MSLIRIETEKLILRSLQIEDAKQIAFHAAHSDISHMSCSIPSFWFPLAVEGWILIARAQYYYQNGRKPKSFVLAICDRKNQNIAGIIELIQMRDLNGNLEYVLEYWITKFYRHQGFDRESVCGFLKYVFQKWSINTVSTYVFEDDLESFQALQKTGFGVTGLKQERYSLAQQKKVVLKHMVCQIHTFSEHNFLKTQNKVVKIQFPKKNTFQKKKYRECMT